MKNDVKHDSRPRVVAVLSGAATAILAADFGLKYFGHAGLCPTSACAVVGHYARIGEPGLLGLGLVFFLSLCLTSLFHDRLERRGLGQARFVLILSALAFDGVLLAYQYIGLGQSCALCLGVGAALIICLAGLTWERRDWALAVLGLSVFFGSLTATSMVRISPKIPTLEQAAMFTKPAEFIPPDQASPFKLHFFFSMHCEHCDTIMENLAVNNPRQAQWQLSTLDSDPDSLSRLALVNSSPLAKTNPFAAIMEAKAAKNVPINQDIPENLKHSVENAQDYYRAAGYETVPVLISYEAPGRRVIAMGVENILGYLQARGFVTRFVTPGSKSPV